MMSIKRSMLLLSGMAGTVMLLTATPASAATATASSIFPNSYTAGYLISGTGETQAAATFAIPTLTCTAAQAFYITVQLEGGGSTVASAYSFVNVGCSG